MPPFAARVLGWRDLVAAVRDAPPSAVAVVDPFAEDGASIDPRVLDLLAATRSVPVVALVPFRASALDAVRALLAAGLTDVADAEMENTGEAIRPRLLAVHAQPLKRRLEPALSRFTSANALTLLRAAADVTTDGGSVGALASVFGSTERTVAGWCERDGLPSPRRLMAWMRLLLALLLLEEPHRAVAAAARCAGYSYDQSFRRALRELLGESESRHRSFARAVERFNDELRGARERARLRDRGRRAA